MENLQHNFIQWQQRVVVTSATPPPPQIAIDLPQITVQADSDQEEDSTDMRQSVDLLAPDIVLKQHRSKSDSGLTPGLLGPKAPHLETYSTEELHPSTTLLSLSSITNTVKLRQVYATTQVDHNLICPTLFQPLSTDDKKDELACSNNNTTTDEVDNNAQHCQVSPTTTSSVIFKKPRSMSLADKSSSDLPIVHRRASDIAFHVTPETKTKRSHSLVNTAEIMPGRRASDFAFHLCPLTGETEAVRKPRSQSLVPGLHEYKIAFPESVKLKPRSQSLLPGSEGLTSHLVEQSSSQSSVEEAKSASGRLKLRSHSLVPGSEGLTTHLVETRKPRSQSLVPGSEGLTFHLVEERQKSRSQSLVHSIEEHTDVDSGFVRLKPRSQSLVPSMEGRISEVDVSSLRLKPRSQSLVPGVGEHEIDVSSSRRKSSISQSLVPSLEEEEQSEEVPSSSRLKLRSQSLVQGSTEHSQCLQVHRRASDFSVQTEETEQKCTDGKHCGTPPEMCSRSQSLVGESEEVTFDSIECTDGIHCGTPPQHNPEDRASDFAFTVQPCTDGTHCGTPPKPRSQSLVHGSEANNKILYLQKRRASDFDFYLRKPIQICSKVSCICRGDLKEGLPSWCLHISRSFSAERPVRPTLDFDSRQHDPGCYNGRRRGSAPVTYTVAEPCKVEPPPCERTGALRGGNENYASTGRRWSIPTEVPDHNPTNLQPPDPSLLNAPRRSSFGLLEPLLAGLETNILNPLGYHKLQPGDILSPFMSPSRRRGSLPTDLLKNSGQADVGRRDLLSVLIGSRRRVSGGLEMLRCLWRGAWGEEPEMEADTGGPCISYQPRRGSAPITSETLLNRENQPS